MRTENAGKKLSPRREAFAAEYLKDLNATRAAIRAGYSAKTASSIGARLLADAGVARAVEAGMAARARRTEIDADRVVLELARIAFADPRDLMEWGPDGLELKESSSLTEEQAAGVAEVAEGSASKSTTRSGRWSFLASTSACSGKGRKLTTPVRRRRGAK